MNSNLRYTDFTHASVLVTAFHDSVLFGYENHVANVIFPNGSHQATLAPENLMTENSDAEHHSNCMPNATIEVFEWLTYGYDIVAVPYGFNRSGMAVVDQSGRHGHCLFWARANGSIGKVITMRYHIVDLAPLRYLIDAGRAACRVSAWLGGVGARQDYAVIRLILVKSFMALKTIEVGKTK